MREKVFSLKISGPAGTGIMIAGESFSKALNRLGFNTLVYPEYPSRIRGGDNNIQIVFSVKKFLSPQEKVDLFLALDEETFREHEKEAVKNGQAFLGSKLGLNDIAKDLGNPLVLNTAGLGFLWGVLDFDFQILQDQLTEDFGRKKELLGLNIEAAVKGYDRGKKTESLKGFNLIIPKARVGIANLTGNEVLTEGIVKAGCEFAAIYPMTPINSVLTILAASSQVKLFRPEDEIAGVLSAIGASYAGKRSMVATSGGGYSLMIEGVGMAGMAEIPLVVVLGQRTGPSSGIATYSSQSDLNFAIYGGHGEFPRIVLTPGDLKELSWLGAEAFNLADIYQVPVILMTDKYLAESRFTTPSGEINQKVKINRGKPAKVDKDKKYARYFLSPDGVSPRAFPGQTTFLTNSYEHDQFGFSADEVLIRNRMMDKRMKKLRNLSGGFEEFNTGGQTTLVSWGSTKTVLQDYIHTHPGFNLIHIWRPWPFGNDLKKKLLGQKRVVVVEGNYSGQLAGLIRTQTGMETEKILKDDGRPFFKEELERLLKQ